MGIHIGSIIYQFTEITESADHCHRDDLFQYVFQTKGGKRVWFDDGNFRFMIHYFLLFR